MTLVPSERVIDPTPEPDIPFWIRRSVVPPWTNRKVVPSLPANETVLPTVVAAASIALTRDVRSVSKPEKVAIPFVPLTPAAVKLASDKPPGVKLNLVVPLKALVTATTVSIADKVESE